MFHSKALEAALLKWESTEHTVEEKLENLQSAIFTHLGLVEGDSEYYISHGKFYERYVAGFIARFFWALQDLSFIALDPLHIFDIITTFVKQLISHPIQLLKSIWDIWTWYFTHGAFGVGMLTADAVVAFVLAASGTLLAGGLKVAMGSGLATIPETLISNLTYVPEKIVSVAKTIKTTAVTGFDIFKKIQVNPKLALSDAVNSLGSGISYGIVREFKMYTNPFLQKS